jgi:hypothetical protein
VKLSIVVMVGTRRSRGQRAVDAAAVSAAGCPAEILICELAPGQRPLRLPTQPPAATLPGVGSTLGSARAAAARAARGQLVAYLEDHCYPDPGWAPALCARAEQDWSAVGYAFRNANPASRASRALALLEYGHWAVPAGPASAASMLAGNNIAYRREALLALGGQLEELLDIDWVLQRTLRERGGKLLFESGAVAAHEHFERVCDSLEILAIYGALSVQRRCRIEQWTLGRRLLHLALALPAVPALRIGRLLRARPDLAGRVLRSAPLILLPALASAYGELLGAARPTRLDAAGRFAALEMELVRVR